MSRLASWGFDVSTSCMLCSGHGHIETRDHLFIKCVFARVIWDKIFFRIGLPRRTRFSDWDSLMRWTKVRKNSSPPTLRLLILHTLVYSIWRQRNNLTHNQITIPPLAIFKEIDRNIINTITARRHLKNFRNLMGFWLY